MTHIEKIDIDIENICLTSVSFHYIFAAEKDKKSKLKN